jgi:hypothetical protein
MSKRTRAPAQHSHDAGSHYDDDVYDKDENYFASAHVDAHANTDSDSDGDGDGVEKGLRRPLQLRRRDFEVEHDDTHHIRPLQRARSQDGTAYTAYTAYATPRVRHHDDDYDDDDGAKTHKAAWGDMSQRHDRRPFVPEAVRIRAGIRPPRSTNDERVAAAAEMRQLRSLSSKLADADHDSAIASIAASLGRVRVSVHPGTTSSSSTAAMGGRRQRRRRTSRLYP